MISLNDYQPYMEEEMIVGIERLASGLRGISIQHINSTYVGGGVAELLNSLVAIMNSVGLKAKWDVIKAEPRFFEVTKAFHNAFHGKELNLTEEMVDTYRQTSQDNAGVVDSRTDFVVIHDQQPLGLAEYRPEHKGKWVWYCHIDPVNVDGKLWEFLSKYAKQCDAAIYHIEDYAKQLGNQRFILPPAIDPLSEKNRETTFSEESEVRSKLGIPEDKPIILQVSRFDRLKNPFGLVKAFLKLNEEIPCLLILAGGTAADDPEGQQVLNELEHLINNHPSIRVLNLPPTSHLEINVLQRIADVIVQNSEREGFGLTVTEALWKGKPVVATPVGGIRKQVIHEKTGLVASNTRELTHCMKRLIQDSELARHLGENGKEHVRKNFITPVYLYNWLKLLNRLAG